MPAQTGHRTPRAAKYHQGTRTPCASYVGYGSCRLCTNALTNSISTKPRIRPISIATIAILRRRAAPIRNDLWIDISNAGIKGGITSIASHKSSGGPDKFANISRSRSSLCADHDISTGGLESSEAPVEQPAALCPLSRSINSLPAIPIPAYKPVSPYGLYQSSGMTSSPAGVINARRIFSLTVRLMKWVLASAMLALKPSLKIPPNLGIGRSLA
jgi:hypothetical protein